MIVLERVKLKEEVVDAPEILTVIGSIPHLEPFLNSLYSCNYKAFFKVNSGVPLLLPSPFGTQAARVACSGVACCGT